MYFTGYPIHIVAAHMLPGMLVVGVSIWLVVNGFGRYARRERGGVWRIVSGLAVLLFFAVCLVATLWYFRDIRRPEIYNQATRHQIPVAATRPPDFVPHEVVEDYVAGNLLWRSFPSSRTLSLPDELKLGTLPEATAFFMPFVREHRSKGTEALARALMDAIGSGKCDEAIPVSHGGDEDHLRGEIQKDVAMLYNLFGSKLKHIRFRPAYGRDFDFIRMGIHSGKSPRFQPSGASVPEFPLQPPGIWLVAEAVVELYDMEMPVATWYAVETDDGVCGLASSAFSHDELPQPENMEEVRDSIWGLLKAESRHLVSDGRIRTISQYLRKLPAGPAGKPVLSIIVLEEPVPLDSSER